MIFLYLGQLFNGSTALHRANAIKRIGNNVIKINTLPKQNLFYRGLNKLFVKIFGYRVEDIKLNKDIVNLIKNSLEIDCLWVDKGLRVDPKVLRVIRQKFPKIVLIHYSPDDMLNPNNQTKYYLDSIPFYDLHVTTKSYNVQEIKILGASDVLFISNAFEPTVHRLIKLNTTEFFYYGAEVGFIGAFEKDRAESIEYLCRRGIKVKVWGRSWKNRMITIPNLEVIEKDMLEDEYAKVLNATAINLCFLRKVNRDLQTTRTMEIPASGGFMLAERTDEHLQLFSEGIEADFFSSNEELYEKVFYYIKNPELRRGIAENGYSKCLTAGYSNDDRMLQIIQYAKRYFDGRCSN